MALIGMRLLSGVKVSKQPNLQEACVLSSPAFVLEKGDNEAVFEKTLKEVEGFNA